MKDQKEVADTQQPAESRFAHDAQQMQRSHGPLPTRGDKQMFRVLSATTKVGTEGFLFCEDVN